MKKIIIFPLILFLMTHNHSITDATSYPSNKTESIPHLTEYIELCGIPGNEVKHTLF